MRYTRLEIHWLYEYGEHQIPKYDMHKMISPSLNNDTTCVERHDAHSLQNLLVVGWRLAYLGDDDRCIKVLKPFRWRLRITHMNHSTQVTSVKFEHQHISLTLHFRSISLTGTRRIHFVTYMFFGNGAIEWQAYVHIKSLDLKNTGASCSKSFNKEHWKK